MYKLEVTIEDLKLIGEGLSQLPYRMVKELFVKLEEQVSNQSKEKEKKV